MDRGKVIYPELSYRLVGMLFKIHSKLGNKYQEKYYQRALEIELKKERIIFERELCVNLLYGNQKIGKYYFDFLIDNKIVVELKAVDRFKLVDFKQVAAYLKSKELKLGMLVNFRTDKLTYKRVLNPSLINYSQ